MTSQKFKFVNMGLVQCISRKDLYGVVEAKQCFYPPPPICSKRLICGQVGFLFLFFLNMPAYPIISKFSFRDVITSLLYSIELAFQYLRGQCYKNEGSGICIRYLPAGCISHFLIKLLRASVLHSEFSFRSSQATFPAHGLTAVSQSIRQPCILHHCL